MNSQNATVSDSTMKHAMPLCLTVLLAVTAVRPAAGAIDVDGFVGGPGDSYSQLYYVTFDVEDGPTGLGGGRLYLHEDSDSLWVGFVAPLSTDDNTYGANKAADWHGIKHILRDGGGDSLEGSDKWAINFDHLGASGKFELKLDYVHDDKDNTDTVFDARVEKLKVNNVDVKDALKILQYIPAFDTSLAYNHDLPGTEDYFETHNEYNENSPVPSPLESDFSTLGWIPEIMYEVQLNKQPFSDLGYPLDADSFRDDFFLDASIFHMSPLKNGHHKLDPTGVAPIPEPASFIVWGVLGAASIGISWYRRRRKAG